MTAAPLFSSPIGSVYAVAPATADAHASAQLLGRCSGVGYMPPRAPRAPAPHAVPLRLRPTSAAAAAALGRSASALTAPTRPAGALSARRSAVAPAGACAARRAMYARLFNSLALSALGGPTARRAGVARRLGPLQGQARRGRALRGLANALAARRRTLPRCSARAAAATAARPRALAPRRCRVRANARLPRSFARSLAGVPPSAARAPRYGLARFARRGRPGRLRGANTGVQ